MDLFNKNRPQYLYADKLEQKKRMNHALSISYFTFYFFICLIMVIAIARGERTLMVGGLIIVLSIAAFLTGFILNKVSPASDKFKWVSFIWLAFLAFFTNAIFDSYYFRFLMVVPLVGCIFYFDRKYTLITALVLDVIYLFTSIQKVVLQLEGLDRLNEMEATSVVVLMSIIIIMMEHVGEAFNDQVIGAVEEEKAEQKETLRNLLGITHRVRKPLRNAMEVMTDLSTKNKEVTDDVKNIAENNQNTAENIQNQTVMTQNIQESIATTIEQCESMKEMAISTTEINESSGQIMKQMTEQAESISATNAEVAGIMKSLQEKSNAVQGITGTILSISSQTNLLALNASIEAARAGDSGKGFAVVADEIRELAQNTKIETENIARILNELSQNADKAVSAVNQSVSAAKAQEALINEASESFERIDTDISRLSENIQMIDGKLQDLNASNNQIVDSISQLSAVTEEVSASSLEAENLSQNNLANADKTKDLLQLVMDVSRELDRYKEDQEVQ